MTFYCSGESPSPDKDLMLESLPIEIDPILQTLTQEKQILRYISDLNGKHPMTLEEEIGKLLT